VHFPCIRICVIWLACTSPSLTFPMMVCRCLAHNASWPTGRRVRLASTPTAAGLAYPGPDGVNFISQVIVARKAVVAFHFVDFMETIITVGKNNAVIYVSVVKTSLRTLKCTSALWVISPVMTVIRHPLFFYPLYQKHLLCTRISLLASVDHCLSLSIYIYDNTPSASILERCAWEWKQFVSHPTGTGVTVTIYIYISQRAGTDPCTTSGSALFRCSDARRFSHTHRTGPSRFFCCCSIHLELSIPAEIRLCENILTIKRHLKTHLFRLT